MFPLFLFYQSFMINVIKYFLPKGGDSMTKTIEAIYENGVLRPVIPIKGLKKNERVAITVKKAHTLNSGDMILKFSHSMASERGRIENKPVAV